MCCWNVDTVSWMVCVYVWHLCRVGQTTILRSNCLVTAPPAQQNSMGWCLASRGVPVCGGCALKWLATAEYARPALLDESRMLETVCFFCRR